MISRFWQKIPTYPGVFLISLPRRNLDVFSQGHWGLFQIIFSFSHKIVFFFMILAISFSLFCDRIAKHFIIYFTGTSSVFNIWKMYRSPKYHMWYLWSLQTPSGPADSLKTETIRVFMFLFWQRCTIFKMMMGEASLKT